MSPLMLDDTGVHSVAMKNRKRFTVVPAKPQDVRRLVDIEFHAFENEQVNQVLSYRDHKKPVHFERRVEAYQRCLNDERDTNRAGEGRDYHPVKYPQMESNIIFRKIVQIETGEVVSFTQFEMKRYTREELRTPADIGHENEPRMNRDWFALNERLRREYMGMSEHCYVGMLATEPKHQHNGAGTMLLEEILAEADDAAVEVYLEATDTAKPLYKKYGFEALNELRFDPAKYGVKGLGVERQTVMVRGALGGDGGRRAVRSWEAARAGVQADLQQ